MAYPECPIHGNGGKLAKNIAGASVIRYGRTAEARPRQVFQCRFQFTDGTEGTHRFREVIPRLMDPDPTCDECGAPTDEWRGEQVMERYWFPARATAMALAKVAAGETYRRAAEELRQVSDRQANPLDRRRIRTTNRVQSLLATGIPSDVLKAHRLQGRNPTRNYSNAAHVIEWLLETFAEALHRKLAPQAWPDGGILAVDALKMNLLGKHKYVDGNGDVQDQPRGADGYYTTPVGGTVLPDVERVERDVIEMLDPDEEDEGEILKAFADLFTPIALRPGTQGGVPCWQVLAAYGYERNAAGEFPRDQVVGKPWLFRAYYQPNALTWAHFFRQLPGRPAYVLCDMAHEIRVGVELAWPDATERPKILACEYHVIQALQRRVAGDSKLEEAARRAFQSWGRRVQGEYHPHVPNGGPGSILRLWHFWEFRRLAREAERLEFDSLFRRPTWRRIMAQAVDKDNTLRYSTGALENALYDLVAPKLESRRHRLKNRRRTNCLLALFQLNALHVANQDTLFTILEQTLRELGATPRQGRAVDDSHAPASLRAPITDAELLAAGLPDHAGYEAFLKTRKYRLAYERQAERYRRDAEYRVAANQRRVVRRRRNDPGNSARKTWHQQNLEKERTAARGRKASVMASDPNKVREQGRHFHRAKTLAGETGCTQSEARSLLAAVEWDLNAAREIIGMPKIQPHNEVPNA